MRATVERALGLLVNAARVSPPLREAVAEVEDELRRLDRLDPDVMPVDPPEDRSDLVAMGHWVADCLDEEDHLVWRTVVRRLVDEVERLRGCATHGTVDAATLCEREPRRIPACPCDQEPYQ